MENKLFNNELSFEERVDWLIDELTLEEKISCMTTGVPHMERLSIHEFYFGGEAAHGVQARRDQSFDKGKAVYTTIFPNPIGMSATWDTRLIHEAGKIASREARAIYNRKDNGVLCVWAPTVDMERDPRWGRNEEGYGEDPHLTGRMAAAYVNGLSGDGKYLRCASTLKHFYANNSEQDRCSTSSDMNEKDKWEYYLEVFRQVIKYSRAEAVMAAYNAVNGMPCAINPELQDILKDSFGLNHTVCDGGGMQPVVNAHHYFEDHYETVTAGLKNGQDMFTDDFDVVTEAVKKAYDKGLISMDDINRSIRNHFMTAMRLGLFDKDAHRDCSEADINNEKGRALSRQIQRESVVLLKNQDNTLPLKKGDSDIIIVGPHADMTYLDWYSGINDNYVTLKQGVENALKGTGKKVNVESICPVVKLKANIGKCSDEYKKKLKSNNIDPDKEYYIGRRADEYVNLTESDRALTFEAMLWDDERMTFTCTDNGKLLTTADEKKVINSIDINREYLSVKAQKAFGWFVKEVFLPADCEGNIISFNENDAEQFTTDNRIEKLCSWNNKNIFMDENGNIFADPDIEVSDDSVFDDICVLSITMEPVDFEKDVELKPESGSLEKSGKDSSGTTCIAAFGSHPLINCKEETDRKTIEFPPFQKAIYKKLTGKYENVILVLIGSYPFAIKDEIDASKAAVWTVTGAEEFGNGIADILFGDYSPAGRLNETWYNSDDDLNPIADYAIADGNRTYMFFNKKPLYPFGYGLSYTTFSYDNLSVNIREKTEDEIKKLLVITGEDLILKSLKNRYFEDTVIEKRSRYYDKNLEDKIIEISLELSNIGDVKSDEVVQCYVSKLPEESKEKSGVGMLPRKQLKAFVRVKELIPGERRTVKLFIDTDDLRFYDENQKKMVVLPGKYVLSIGNSEESYIKDEFEI